LNAARNTGIKNSTGEVIAFTDSDCIVSKNWVKKIVEDFGEKEVGCVGGNALRFYDDLISRYCDESLMPVMRIFTEKKALNEVKPPVQYPAGCNMAIRRSILAEAGEFDENIEYGFDEDELVERICSTGHTMVLDPDLLVSHKHRSSVRELLKQTFRYGRGMGVLLREKGLKSIFSKWILLIIFGLILWTALLSSLSILAVLTGSLGFLYVFSGLLVFPFASLALFYVYRTVVYRDRKWKRIFAYPLIDVSRFVVFVFGSVYQLVKSYRKRRNQ
jgi:GT2 family glycosyltransferase